MADNKLENKSENNRANHRDGKVQNQGRVIQIIPAAGWRAFQFSHGEDGNLNSKEVAVIGWGLRDDGNVSLLIPHPNKSSGHAAVSIEDVPASIGEKSDHKFVHYQAISPFQEPADAEKEAQFVLSFVSSNMKAAEERAKGTH
jgi:hypothetical protein